MVAPANNTLTKDDFICPILREIMLHPVQLELCGHRFDEIAIRPWVDAGHPCPLDRREVEQIVPDEEFEHAIRAYVTEHPEEFENKTFEELRAELDEAFQESRIEMLQRFCGRIRNGLQAIPLEYVIVPGVFVGFVGLFVVGRYLWPSSLPANSWYYDRLQSIVAKGLGFDQMEPCLIPTWSQMQSEIAKYLGYNQMEPCPVPIHKHLSLFYWRIQQLMT